jgi:hypothetical protein
MNAPAAPPRPPLRIGVLLDAAAPSGSALEAAEAVQLALRDLGHTPLRVPLSGAPDAWLARVSEASLDLLFNLCGADARIAAALELLALPMTGCGSELLSLARRRTYLRAVLRAASLPVGGQGGREIDVGIVGERALPADGLGAAHAEEGAALAMAAWRALEGRGYGRVRLRRDGTGRLYVTDVAPNPDLAPSASMTRAAAAAGWGYLDLIGGIVRAALA